MKNLNNCVFVGRVTRDAELKYTASGTPLLSFSLCVNGRKKNGEEWVDVPNFFDFVIWGKWGESMQKHITKGRQLTVMSEAERQTWNDEGGNQRSKISFKVVDGGLELGQVPRAQGEGEAPRSTERPSSGVYVPKTREEKAAEDFDPGAYEDDIPF